MGLTKLPWFERITLALSGLTLLVALGAWTLMRFGAFTLGRVAAIAAIGTAAALGATVATRRRPRTAPPRESWRVAGAAAVICAGFGVLYARYPTYFLLGGQDPGPYLAFAARIAKTGGLKLQLPEVAHFIATHAPGIIRPVPAVYGSYTDPPDPKLQAQFLHLFTAYDATFFAVRGVAGAVRANAWLAVLCLATGFAFVRRLESTRAAFVLVLALGLNPAFLWASRITLTEVLALWLNLSGLLLLLIAWDLEAISAALLGGGALGLGVLNRVDGGLGATALFAVAVAALLEPSRRRIALAAIVANAGVSALAYWDDTRLSPTYLEQLALNSNSVTALPIVTLGLDAAALVLTLLPSRLRRALWLNETTLRLIAYSVLWGVVGWVLYGLFLRPLVDTGDDGRTLRELTWYVSAVAWPLMLGGLAFGLGARRFARWLPFVAFTLATLVIYTARTDVAPVHIWASRRWVPHVIPLMLVSSALAATTLVGRVRRRATALVLGGAAAALYFVTVLRFDAPFLFRSMLEGLPERYERVAAFASRHRGQWPLITENVHLGSILSYVYDTPTVILNGERGDAAFMHGDFAGGLGVGFNAFDLHHATEDPEVYTGPYLEQAHGHRPRELVQARYSFEIGEIGPRLYDMTVPASHPSLGSQKSLRTSGGGVRSVGKACILLNGPWVTLDAGRYHVAWYGQLEDAPKEGRQAFFDVIHHATKESFAEAPLELPHPTLKEDVLVALDFTLKTRTEGIEFRARASDGVYLTLTKVRLQYFGNR